jgi:glyoxylase-like metal-dependent hydrolase (beta-lactamase superfamily II)
MTELAPGLHRIESDLGERFMAQYVLAGPDRTVLVDTGLADTPVDVLEPYLDRAGLEPDLVVISHADVDHCGGNRALRRRHPHALFACHELDRRWIESNEAMVRENYGWHAACGFPRTDAAEMLRLLGGDAPIDVGFTGGETIRLGPGRIVEVLHLPGHTPGHLGLWDEHTGAAIVIDAVLADGIYDRHGTKLIPPRYYELDGVRATIARLQALRPELLLTAHYPVMGRDEAQEWLAEGLAWVDEVGRVVRAAGTTDLWELTQLVDRELGPYPEFRTELGATVRAALG